MKVHPELAERIAQRFPAEYGSFLDANRWPDDTRFRKLWTAAFNLGFTVSREWIAADELPKKNDFYLVTTTHEHDKMGKTRVAYHRDGKWLWFVEDGVLEVYNVLAWQPLPDTYSHDTDEQHLGKGLMGFGTTVRQLGRFLKDLAHVEGSFSDGRIWRIENDGERWLFELGGYRHETSSLILGFKWLVTSKRRGRPRSQHSRFDSE